MAPATECHCFPFMHNPEAGTGRLSRIMVDVSFQSMSADLGIQDYESLQNSIDVKRPGIILILVRPQFFAVAIVKMAFF